MVSWCGVYGFESGCKPNQSGKREVEEAGKKGEKATEEKKRVKIK